MESTIFESFTLPSKGMVYSKEINPHVTLRSMTTMEEMKRLSPTDTPYKTMAEIIEACMQEKPEISVYDMCVGDYQFLLHKLRIVTYGPEYKMSIRCPKCGEVSDSIANLESLPLSEWSSNIIADQLITLPKTGHSIELKFQTPRDLDFVEYKNKEMKKKTKQNIDYSILFTIACTIKKVNGTVMNPITLEEFIKGLPSKDANYIMLKSGELNGKVGLENNITVKCSHCGEEVVLPFRFTSEFFGPTND